MDDLNVIEADGVSVAYRGEPLNIQPLTIGQIPDLVRAARPVINSLLEMDSLPDELAGENIDLLLDLVGEHGERVYAAAAIAIGKDPAWVAGGTIDEFIELAKAVVSVNRDFFRQRLAPLLAGRASQKTGVGPTPSS